MYLQALRRSSQYVCKVFLAIKNAYLANEVESHIYSPQRWAKTLDGINGHQVAAGKRLGGLDVQ